MATDSVTQVMFAALTGHKSPVMTRWTYTVSDPCAVTLAVQTPRGRWVSGCSVATCCSPA